MPTHGKQHKSKEEPAQREPRADEQSAGPAQYARIAWAALSFAVLVAGVVLLSAAGRATVHVTLAVEQHEQPVRVQVSSEQTPTPSQEAGTIRLVGDVVESGGSGSASKAIHATRVTPGRSHGIVTIINSTNRAQQLVATTRLLSADNVLFRTTKTVFVPARGRVRVEAASDILGPDGDVAAQRWRIPGLSSSLQRVIFGQSDMPMSGGLTEVRRVDKVDIAEVAAKAEIDAVRAAQNSVTVAPSMFRFSRPTSSVRSFNAKEGENVAELTGDVHATVTHVLIDPVAAHVSLKDFITAAEQAKGNDVVEIRGDVSTFELGKIDRVQKAADLTGTVTVFTRRKTDGLSSDLQHMLAGLTTEEALQRLRARDGVQSAAINVSPPWLWALPKRADHIAVILK